MKIKFRAWDKKNKRMLEVITMNIGSMIDEGKNHEGWFIKGLYTTDEIGGYDQDGPCFICEQYDLTIIEHELMQFTGLKDKGNQKELLYHEDLYHKDLVFVKDHYIVEKGRMGIIEWGEDGWVVLDKEGEFICTLWDYTNNDCGGKKETFMRIMNYSKVGENVYQHSGKMRQSGDPALKKAIFKPKVGEVVTGTFYDDFNVTVKYTNVTVKYTYTQDRTLKDIQKERLSYGEFNSTNR